jgi:hypothetical protein
VGFVGIGYSSMDTTAVAEVWIAACCWVLAVVLELAAEFTLLKIWGMG